MLRLLLSVALLSFLGGCSYGPELIPVSGRVVFQKDGSAAQFGSVEFRSESDPHPVARGKIQKDGTFSLTTGGRSGAIAGWHTVVIIQVAGNTRGSKIKHNHGLDAANKYSDHRTTDLRIDVSDELKNELILEIEDMPWR